MRVLVTGDRDWGNADVYGDVEASRHIQTLTDTLYQLWELAPDTIVVHGNARGADKLAGAIWTKLTGSKQVEAHPADWKQYGRSAGPIRNRAMLTISAERASIDGHILRKAIACHSHLQDSKGTRTWLLH